MNNVKMVLFDLDDTLIPDNGTLSERTAQGLEKLHENGVVLVLASGRSVEELEIRLEGWHMKYGVDAIIGLNGCEYKNLHTGQLHATHKLQPETMAAVLEAMHEAGFKFIPMLYRGMTLLAAKRTPVMERSAANAKRSLEIVDEAELCRVPCAKIMLRTDDGEEVVKMEEWLKTNSVPDTSAFKTQPTLMEFSIPGISKATPLDELGKEFGVKREEMLAFGDSTNDNQLLIDAGKGVALANAAHDTLAIADDVTEKPVTEDGLIEYIALHYPEILK